MARSLPGTKKGTGTEGQDGVGCPASSPTQDAKYKVEDEEGTKDDETHKIHPGQLIPHGILHLGKERACIPQGMQTLPPELGEER